MSRFDAVLFDWRGTLVHDPENEWWLERAHAAIGRTPEPASIARLAAGLDMAAHLPEFAAAFESADCSPDLHRAASAAMFESAGLDDELATALYELDLDAASHPFYPDVAEVFTALRHSATKVAVIANVHFDLRPEFGAAGLSADVDAFVLSFELGIQKPDPRAFEVALDAVGVSADRALMVGDRPAVDGAAVHVGIATLVLPRLPRFGPRGLVSVLALVQECH